MILWARRCSLTEIIDPFVPFSSCPDVARNFVAFSLDAFEGLFVGSTVLDRRCQRSSPDFSCQIVPVPLFFKLHSSSRNVSTLASTTKYSLRHRQAHNRYSRQPNLAPNSLVFATLKDERKNNRQRFKIASRYNRGSQVDYTRYYRTYTLVIV